MFLESKNLLHRTATLLTLLCAAHFIVISASSQNDDKADPAVVKSSNDSSEFGELSKEQKELPQKKLFELLVIN